MTDFIHFPTLKRPKKPNNCLFAPAGLCGAAAPDAAAPIFPASARGLYVRLLELIDAEKYWGEVHADPDMMRMRFVARTPLMGFKDDVDIAVIGPDQGAGDGETGATLALYSRSRIGYSDLGTNRKRVEGLIAALLAH